MISIGLHKGSMLLLTALTLLNPRPKNYIFAKTQVICKKKLHYQHYGLQVIQAHKGSYLNINITLSNRESQENQLPDLFYMLHFQESISHYLYDTAHSINKY